MSLRSTSDAKVLRDKKAGSPWGQGSTEDGWVTGRTSLPVLASTQLCLQLMAQDGFPELRAIADLLLQDPCAVLRVFAAAGEECVDRRLRPERLQDCIAYLEISGVQRALNSVCSPPDEQVRLCSLAQEAVRCANLCRRVALPLGLWEEQAQLIGLLRSIGRYPAAMAHAPEPVSSVEAAASTAEIARTHHLPTWLISALQAVCLAEAGSVWVAMLAAAEDLAATQACAPLSPVAPCRARVQATNS